MLLVNFIVLLIGFKNTFLTLLTLRFFYTLSLNLITKEENVRNRQGAGAESRNFMTVFFCFCFVGFPANGSPKWDVFFFLTPFTF